MLTDPGEVELYLPAADAAVVSSKYMPQRSLAPNADGDAAAAAATASPDAWVLKPQREGGGNSVYGAVVVTALACMSPTERGGWVLMRSIYPVRGQSVVVRDSAGGAGEVVSELRVFGTYLATAAGKVTLNETTGTLFRRKLADAEDGGVAVGVAVLD